jgi:hypothetical protein
MEDESIGKRGMGINYKGSQGQSKRAVVLEEEEELLILNIQSVTTNILNQMTYL